MKFNISITFNRNVITSPYRLDSLLNMQMDLSLFFHDSELHAAIGQRSLKWALFWVAHFSLDIGHAIIRDDYHIHIVAGAISFTIFQNHMDILFFKGIRKISERGVKSLVPL